MIFHKKNNPSFTRNIKTIENQIIYNRTIFFKEKIMKTYNKR